jgi:hypothetical protein
LSSPVYPEASASRFRVSPNLIFGLILAAICIYFLWASLKWPSGAALLPRTASVFGLVMLVGYGVSSVRDAKSGKVQGRILDVGRLETAEGDHQAVRGRLIIAIGSILALVLGLWVLGFHIAIPVYLLAYLIFIGKVPWWRAVLAAVIFELILVGLYDNVIHVSWNETLLDRLLGRGAGF